MMYEFRISETKVITFAIRYWGSHSHKNISIREGNKMIVDHNRQLWGHRMELMNKDDFLEAIGLTLEEFQAVVIIANKFKHVQTI